MFLRIRGQHFFGIALADGLSERELQMLKITVHETPHRITLKLEGSLVGTWVAELEDVWRAEVSKRTGRLICLDLAAVDAIDAAGRYLLLLISDRGTQMIGSGGRELDGLAEIVEGWRLEKGC